jgi:hypothetical protein
MLLDEGADLAAQDDCVSIAVEEPRLELGGFEVKLKKSNSMSCRVSSPLSVHG